MHKNNYHSKEEMLLDDDPRNGDRSVVFDSWLAGDFQEKGVINMRWNCKHQLLHESQNDCVLCNNDGNNDNLCATQQLNDILCSGKFSRIEELTLSSIRTTAEWSNHVPLPIQGICKLPNLIRLDLFQVSALPPDIKKLTRIKKLVLANSPFLERLPSELGSLNLESLIIRECPNLLTLPPEIGQLEHLQKLQITPTHPEWSFPMEILQLYNLQELVLDPMGADKFTRLPRVCELQSLVRLEIQARSFIPWETGAPLEIPRGIDNLESLRELKLWSTRPFSGGNVINNHNFAIRPVPALANMKHLTTIEIRDSQTSIPPEIKDVVNLENLTLGGLKLETLLSFFSGAWNGIASPKRLYIECVHGSFRTEDCERYLEGLPSSLVELEMKNVLIYDYNVFVQGLPRGIQNVSVWGLSPQLLDPHGQSCLEKLVDNYPELGHISVFVPPRDQAKVLTTRFFHGLFHNRCSIDKILTTTMAIACWPLVLERVTRQFVSPTMHGVPAGSAGYCPNRKNIEATLIYTLITRIPNIWLSASCGET